MDIINSNENIDICSSSAQLFEMPRKSDMSDGRRLPLCSWWPAVEGLSSGEVIVSYQLWWK